MTRIGIRWTIGDVSEEGIAALRLSIWGMWRLVGGDAAFRVYVNTVPLDAVRDRVGAVPAPVEWRTADRSEIPPAIAAHLDAALAEGVAWKFAPVRAFPDAHELSLDNDCILWAMPREIERWLRDGDRCLIAADVRACFGQYAALCGPEPRNSGIRGLPPGFDVERALVRTLHEHPATLTSETDEQGLQVAALSRGREPVVVGVDDVTICSPFPPHLPHLGRCGAHFVGLNARQLPWEYEGRNGADYIREHWAAHRDVLRARVGAPAPARG
ncbi:MAG TPA: hypothetical protein VF041_06865 [Gemmatimonadaceae bacterium]